MGLSVTFVLCVSLCACSDDVHMLFRIWFVHVLLAIKRSMHGRRVALGREGVTVPVLCTYHNVKLRRMCIHCKDLMQVDVSRPSCREATTRCLITCFWQAFSIVLY